MTAKRERTMTIFLLILLLPIILFAILALLPGSKVGFIFIFPVVFVSTGETSSAVALLATLVVIVYVFYMFFFIVRALPGHHPIHTESADIAFRGTAPPREMEGEFGGVIFIGPFPILLGGAKGLNLDWFIIVGMAIWFSFLILVMFLLAAGI